MVLEEGEIEKKRNYFYVHLYINNIIMIKKKKKRKKGSSKVVKGKEAIAGVKKIRKVGATYYIALPREFLDRHKLREGDELPFVGNGILKFVPVDRDDSIAVAKVAEKEDSLHAESS